MFATKGKGSFRSARQYHQSVCNPGGWSWVLNWWIRPPLFEGGMIIIGTWLTQKTPYSSKRRDKDFSNNGKAQEPDDVLGVVSCATEYRIGDKPMSLVNVTLDPDRREKQCISLYTLYIATMRSFSWTLTPPKGSTIPTLFPCFEPKTLLRLLALCICMYYGTGT